MLLFIDFESYWDRQVTLKKLTPPEYIFHKKFHVHGASFKVGVDGKSTWFDADAIPHVLARLDPEKTAICYFNALFDQCITSWIYGFTPALIIDAMGMARSLYGHKFKSFSLANVARELELGAKGHEGVGTANTLGLTTAELRAQPELWEAFKRYGNNDNDLCAGVYAHCLPRFPAEQFVWMDLVLRCAVQPAFKLNRRTCVMHRREARKKKWAILRACGADKPDLMSTSKFKALLESYGVVVEMKDSPTDVKNGKFPSSQYERDVSEQLVCDDNKDPTLEDVLPDKALYCREIPACSKTDEFMARLAEHDDPVVAALAAARLGVRSTQAETRAARFAALARLPERWIRHPKWNWQDGNPIGVRLNTYRAGSAPIALRYGAAHTHRLGGEWKLNFQNLARNSPLRAAIECWPGDVMLAPDYSQIEARLVAWLAGQKNLLGGFARGKDVYSEFATSVFGYEVQRKKRDDAGKLLFEVEGFIGKKGILGLGYGAGAEKLHWMIHNDARNELGHDIDFDIGRVIEVVRVYRKVMYPDIPRLWYLLEGMLNDLMNPTPMEGWHERFPFLEFEHEAIVLPSGMRLTYYGLADTGDGLAYNYGHETRSIYGGKSLENLSQALAGIIVQQAAVRLWRKHRIRFSHQSHDELAFRCRADDAEATRAVIQHELNKVPDWAPGLPVAIELKAGTSYGNVKEWKPNVSWEEFSRH